MEVFVEGDYWHSSESVSKSISLCVLDPCPPERSEPILFLVPTSPHIGLILSIAHALPRALPIITRSR